MYVQKLDENAPIINKSSGKLHLQTELINTGLLQSNVMIKLLSPEAMNTFSLEIWYLSFQPVKVSMR